MSTAPVIIHIDPSGAGDGDFVVRLVETDGTETTAALTRQMLTSGNWTANLTNATNPDGGPDTDIVRRVAGADRASRDHADFTAIAQTLYAWLLPDGPLRQRWLMLNSRGDPPPLYVDTQVEGLMNLPWELACSHQRPLRRPAAINGMYRRFPPPQPGQQCSAWPLRILIVVGSNEAEAEALGVNIEVEQIWRRCIPFGRSADVHRIFRPQKNQLGEWIRTFQPHVLHFVGHAGKLPGPAGKFGLRFDQSDANTWIWSASDIDVDLPAWRWTPKFVFLNACRTAAEWDGSWSVLRSFLAGGARAALGMQADTRGDLAAMFAARFYERCVLGDSLEQAVFEARMVVANESSYDRIDWAVPSLVVTADNMTLFQPPQRPADLAFQKCAEFDAARLFANFHVERREFTHWMYPANGGQPEKNVLIVQGEPKSGKSHLLKWCMESWAIGGARVRYIELDPAKPLSFISVVRQIRNGESNGSDEKMYLHQGLPHSSFDRFNYELNHVLQTGQIPEWDDGRQYPVAELTDQEYPWVARGEQRLEEIVGARFVAALRLAAARNPVILVFDLLSGPDGGRLLPVEEFEQLLLHVFRPIAEDEGSRIKIVLSASAAEARDFKFRLLPDNRTATWQVPVAFSDDQLARLAAEMLRFKNQEAVENIARSLFAFPLDPNPPQGLARLEAVATAIRSRNRALVDDIPRMK